MLSKLGVYGSQLDDNVLFGWRQGKSKVGALLCSTEYSIIIYVLTLRISRGAYYGIKRLRFIFLLSVCGGGRMQEAKNVYSVVTTKYYLGKLV